MAVIDGSEVLERLVQESQTVGEQLAQLRHEVALLQDQLTLLISSKVTTLEAENASLNRLALTDELTGLYNVRFLRQRLPEEFSRAKRYGNTLSVIVLDVDHFKSVNDSRGHVFGDHLLQHLAQVLQHNIRSSDSVVRYGGDEFVLILPHCDLDEAAHFGERVRAAVETANLGDANVPFYVTISMGIASLESSQADAWAALLLAADRGLYRAKEAGRNRVAVDRPADDVAGVA